MYRKPILSNEDIKSLVGQLVRLEWHPDLATLVGIVQPGSGEGTNHNFVRLDGDRGRLRDRNLRSVRGTYVVFVTTDQVEGPEPRLDPVRWANRSNLPEYAPEPEPVPTFAWVDETAPPPTIAYGGLVDSLRAHRLTIDNAHILDHELTAVMRAAAPRIEYYGIH